MHNMTNNNVFTDPVTNYDDGDPVSNASEETKIQALVNRTYNSKVRLDAEHKSSGAHAAVTADSVAATGDISGTTGTFPAISILSDAAHFLKSLTGVASNGGIALSGGVQDLDITGGAAYQILGYRNSIGVGFTPIIRTIKTGFSFTSGTNNVGLFVLGFATSGADTVIGFEHNTAGSYTKILTPTGGTVSYPVPTDGYCYFLMAQFANNPFIFIVGSSEPHL
jgi:hypothetical protein